MKRTYYIHTSGHMMREHFRIYLASCLAPREALTSIPACNMHTLYLFGNVTMDTSVIGFLGKQHVMLHIYDQYGTYAGSFFPREYASSGMLHVRQVASFLDPGRRTLLARSMVAATCTHMRYALESFSRHVEGEEQELLRASAECVLQEQARLDACEHMSDVQAVREQAQQAYQRAWHRLVQRQGELPPTAFQALLRFGETLCYTTCLERSYHTALDATVGFLHEPQASGFALASDISEVFKPLLVDSLVFRLIHQGLFSPEHVDSHLDGMYLNERGRQVLVRAWEDHLQTAYLHTLTYRDAIDRAYRRLVCYLMEDPEDAPSERFILL